MKIQYRYKLLNSNNIQSTVLNESEYYAQISETENFEDDAIPKHNDLREYQPEISKILFEWVELIISNSIKNDTVIRTEYFARGESQLISRKDANGYELIVQSFLLSTKEIFISRMERNGVNELWTNSSFNLGVNFNGGKEEKWYDLKKGELSNGNTV